MRTRTTVIASNIIVPKSHATEAVLDWARRMGINCRLHLLLVRPLAPATANWLLGNRWIALRTFVERIGSSRQGCNHQLVDAGLRWRRALPESNLMSQETWSLAGVLAQKPEHWAQISSVERMRVRERERASKSGARSLVVVWCSTLTSVAQWATGEQNHKRLRDSWTHTYTIGDGC